MLWRKIEQGRDRGSARGGKKFVDTNLSRSSWGRSQGGGASEI